MKGLRFAVLAFGLAALACALPAGADPGPGRVHIQVYITQSGPVWNSSGTGGFLCEVGSPNDLITLHRSGGEGGTSFGFTTGMTYDAARRRFRDDPRFKGSYETDPDFILDVSAVPTIESGGTVRLDLEITVCTLDRLDEEGKPVYVSTIRERTVTIPMGGDAYLTAYQGPKEAEAGAASGDVVLRFTAEIEDQREHALRHTLRFERVEKATDRVVATAETTAENAAGIPDSEGDGAFQLAPAPPPVPGVGRPCALGYSIAGRLVPVPTEEGSYEVHLSADQTVHVTGEDGKECASLGASTRKSFTVAPGETVRIDLQPVRGRLGCSWDERGCNLQLDETTSRYGERIYLTVREVE